MGKENQRPQRGADLGLTGFWADAPVISTYSTADAVEDGLLIDAQKHPELAEVSRQHCGSRPVYISQHLYAVIEKSATNPRASTDWKGIWHDVLTMSFVAHRPVRDLRAFDVLIVGAGRKRRFHLWVRHNPDGYFFLFPEDD